MKVLEHLFGRSISIGLLLLAGLFSGCGDDASSRTSSLLWSDFYSGPPPVPSSAVAEDVATCEGRYFVVGETHSQMLLRAYTADGGELAWQSSEPFDSSGEARSVVCEEGWVFVSGRSYWERNAAFVRAYDGETGSKLWERVIDEGDWTQDMDLAVAGGALFLLTKSDDRTVMDLFALDTATGDQLWKSSDPDARLPYVSARLSVWNDQVCFARDLGDGDFLRCYDRRSGELLWVAPSVGAEGRPVASRIETGQQLVAFGHGEGLSGVVAAYDPRDGTLLWSRDDFHFVNDVHVLDDRVLVSGIDFRFEGKDEDSEVSIFRVESINASGATVWSDRHDGEGVRHSVLAGDRLFVAGEVWQARVYDAGSGRIVAEQSDLSPPQNRWAWAIAAEHDRFAIVGATYRANSFDLDFAVRAYGISQ